MPSNPRISPCLWFNTEAEDAANFYTGIFKNSRITNIGRYGEGGQEIHGRATGSVMIVVFELDGQQFSALNGGPHFQFTPAISLQVDCKTQAEVDHYWDRLSAGGDPKAQQCGWLKDRFGLSWQIVPDIVPKLLGDAGSPKSQRAMNAMMQMKKPDIAAMQRAYDG